MDLETLEKRLSQHYYRNKESFINDIKLIFENAKKYNRMNSTYYKAATNLEEYIQPYLEKLTEPTEAELKEYEKFPHSRESKNKPGKK